MCVTLTIAAVDKNARLDADELASVTGLLVTRKAAGTYELCPADGCPCDFVGDGRATDANWPVHASLKPALTAAVQLAARRLKRFRFTATWLSDPVPSEAAITLSEMLRLLETGAIGRRSFLVGAG